MKLRTKSILYAILLSLWWIFWATCAAVFLYIITSCSTTRTLPPELTDRSYKSYEEMKKEKFLVPDTARIKNDFEIIGNIYEGVQK